LVVLCIVIYEIPKKDSWIKIRFIMFYANRAGHTTANKNID
jgi:hypothetical protein